MPGFGVALAWMIISPFAFLTDCLSIVFILHYKPLYHTCDIAFISLLVTMATNAWLLLPIPAVVKLGGFYWSQSLCAFYTWLSITLRSSHILVLLVLNVYWMASLRVSPKSNLFTSSKPIAVSVCICWFISLIIGLIPAADVAHVFDYYEDNVCKFLPANISRGFAIFFIIVPLVSTVMGVVSSLDSLLLFKAMKDVALSKYSADRFHLPTISGGVRTSALIHAKYNELTVTIELCRLVLFFSMASSVLNAVPLLASQFVQLIQVYSRETLETTLLWLLLLESLILPHLLWLLSRRYRHAVAYTWRVFVLRDSSAREEDSASCSLQAFRVNVKDVTSRPYRNGGVNSQQINGTVSGPGIEEHSQESTRHEDYTTSRPRTNGFLHTQPANGHADRALEYSLDSSGMTTEVQLELTPVKRITSPELVFLQEATRQKMTHAQKKGQGYDHVHETSLSSGQGEKSDNSPLGNSFRVISDANAINSTQHASPVNSPTKTSSAGPIKRSISGSSRIEWKERMMKKHLPTVLLGSSVEDETDTDLNTDSITDTENISSKFNMQANIPQENIPSRRQDTTPSITANWSSTESTYYLSGDHHYDYLHSTLVRTHPQTNTEVGESSGRYVEEDINIILDNSLTSETVDDFEFDSYLLKNVSTGDDEPQSELLNNAEHIIRKINDPPLPSTEMHQRELQNSLPCEYSNDLPLPSTEIHQREQKNSLPCEYSKSLSSVITNINVSQNGPLNQESSISIPSNQTLQGNSSSTERLPYLTADVINISAAHPNIRRSNYRKFLPYTDLVISDVDDVSADGNLEEGERNGLHKMNYPTSKSEHSSEGGHSPYKEKGQEKETQNKTLLENVSKVKSPETGVTIALGTHATGGNNNNNDDDDYVQDYSKCETVSGSEMLRLKMQSIRAAAAMYSDDTSDDGGIDNNGFIETSNDESDNNIDQYDEKQNSTMFSISKSKKSMTGEDGDQMHSANKESNQVRPASQVDGEFGERRLARDRVGDGEESTAGIHSHGSMATTNYQVVTQNGRYRKEVYVNAGDKPKGAFQKETYNTKSDKKSDNHKEEFTVRNIKQREDKQNEKSKINNINPQLESSDIFGLSESDGLNIPDNSQLITLAGQKGNHVPQDPLNTDLTDIGSDNKHGINDFSWSGVATSVSGSHVPAAVKHAAVIVKPPRQRRMSDESQVITCDSHTDNKHKAVVDIDILTTPNTLPYSGLINHVIPIEETALDSDISEVTDSESTGSDISVTLEPYGYRRPDWMNDLLLETSSHEQTMYRQAREFPSLEEESTDFMSNNNGDIGNDSHQLANISSHQPHPMLAPYHFNDSEDTDNDDYIKLDYSAQSHFYRNKNLCFEAITEEPEYLSDSASSFDQSDNATLNILRDPRITSDRQPSSNLATKSNSPTSINKMYPIKLAEFQRNIPENSADLRFPTSERTSADGSEEIQPAFITCLSNSQTATNTSMKINIKTKSSAMQVEQSLSSKDFVIKTDDTDSTVKQNSQSSGATARDDEPASAVLLGSNIQKYDSLITQDNRSSSNGLFHETTNSGSVELYNGVRFPYQADTGTRIKDVPGATPVYF